MRAIKKEENKRAEAVGNNVATMRANQALKAYKARGVSECGVQDLGFRGKRMKSRVQGLGFMVLGFRI